MNDAATARMIRDLQALAVGIPGQAGGAGLSLGKDTPQDRGSEILLDEATRVLHLIRPAWEALDGEAAESPRERVGATHPRGALASVAGSDWQLRDERWLPTRWQLPAIELERNPHCRRWLIHAAGLAREFFAVRHRRILGWVDEAMRTRVAGDSKWAAQAEIELGHLRDESARLLAEAERLGGFIQNAEGRRLTAWARPPTPFPRAAVWGRLRMHVLNLENPRELLPEMAASSLRLPVAACELPMLYQRWVGDRLVQALQALGWTIASDPFGPLWLGGSIRAVRQDMELRLEVERRYISRTYGNTNLDCVVGESLTPDFTLLFQAPWGQSAWILDATLSREPSIHLEKQEKYLAGLRLSQPSFVASVPTFPRPARSWVASPLGGRLPHLTDANGTMGTISVDPAEEGQPGLMSWLADLQGWVRGRSPA